MVSLKLKCCVRVLKFSPEDCTCENPIHSSAAMPCNIVSQSAYKHIFLSKHLSSVRNDLRNHSLMYANS